MAIEEASEMKVACWARRAGTIAFREGKESESEEEKGGGK